METIKVVQPGLIIYISPHLSNQRKTIKFLSKKDKQLIVRFRLICSDCNHCCNVWLGKSRELSPFFSPLFLWTTGVSEDKQTSLLWGEMSPIFIGTNRGFSFGDSLFLKINGMPGWPRLALHPVKRIEHFNYFNIRSRLGLFVNLNKIFVDVAF